MKYTLKTLLCCILVSVICISSIRCTTVTETGRRAINIFPDSQLEAMSLNAFDQMKANTKVSKNPEHIAMVRRIGNRISAVVAQDFPDTQWEFVVFEDEQVNAFAMAGGKVGVYSGLINIVDSDDELAVVIGHEIAHVTARHSNERMSQKLITSGLGAAILFGTSDMKDEHQAMILAAYGAGTQYGALLPYSRVHENEADEIGLLYAARAGYNPRAAISFWEKMKAQSKGRRPPEWASTHPSDETRLRNLQEVMPRALEYYNLSR